MMKQAWEAQKEIRDVMLFLHTHGIGPGYAAKIFKQYGSGAIQIVRRNPYRLATDILGIGFLTADRIAGKLGFQKDSPMRAEAGILYVLNRLSDDGHVYYPYAALIQQCEEILEIDRDSIIDALATIAYDKKVVIEDLNESVASFEKNNKAVYLPRFYLSESRIAALLHDVMISPKSIRDIDAHRAMAWVQKRLSMTLADNQKKAVRSALENKAVIITGGPGTGKTTIISAILKIFDRIGAKSLLAAPTGRAAKRMSETTGHAAKTIHRLLEFSLQQGGFKRNADHPLDCDVLILDEASMMDTIITYHLLKALPPSATIIFVGDVHQLPSVGAGNVLCDMIESKTVPVVMLNEIFRQAMTSQIIVNAHKINDGQVPFVTRSHSFDRGNDFYFIRQEDPEKVLEIILELTRKRIPRRFDLHPVDDIQVLSPMHRGLVGAENLNRTLQGALNPGDSEILRGGCLFRVRDKVMQIKNDYEKDVYNGDIGTIVRIDEDGQEVGVSYDGREVPYDFADLDEIVLAYAVSVHKSQGSEYPAVVIPILTQHYMLLQRNLLYTAVTRGRRLVVIVGSPKALALCVHNNRTQSRYTHLKTRLRDQFDSGA
jgi:exodeoxyribonuclease V alpha subunit